jgi:hypothetical protein
MFDFKKIPCKCKEATFVPIGGAITTLMYFQPMYNREGKNINPDRNLVRQTFQCTVCKKHWNLSHRGEGTDTHVLEVPGA